LAFNFKSKNINPKHILISRTDKIGDVILTLPLAGVLNKAFPTVKISFLGNSYTKNIVENSNYIKKFYDWDQMKENPVEDLRSIQADVIIHVYPNRKIARAAKQAGIPLRIGTSHRIFHWWTCNKLVNLGRRNSPLHEAQLNLKLLAPLNRETDFSLHQIPDHYGWKKEPVKKFDQYLQKEKFNLILHTKSRGSAREWPLKNFLELAQSLSGNSVNILISGTKEEGKMIASDCPEIFALPQVQDITGKLSLEEFIELIKQSDGLVACSTGPLHIAAASGIHTLGLYPPIKPMHPGRWAPLGAKASYIVKQIECNDCRKTGNCKCLYNISVNAVKEEIDNWISASD
jgi:ADP-heptose:LPS heptosyltransferase